MNATTDARTIVTATAETSASANKAHWSNGDQSVTITRRKLSSGLVRIRITAKRHHVPSAQQAAERSSYRDLNTNEADAMWSNVLAAYDSRYVANLRYRSVRIQGLQTWAAGLRLAV